MTIDYDATHRKDEFEDAEALEELKAVSATQAAQQPNVDQDETEVAETFELPGADLSGESLTVHVDPKHADEFTCARCFLVRHHTQLVDQDAMLCRDCA